MKPPAFPGSKSVQNSPDYAPREIARKSISRRSFFVEVSLRVARDLVFTAKNVILVIVKDFIRGLIAHGHLNSYADLEQPGSSLVVDQHRAEAEIFNHAVHHRVRALGRGNDF